MVKHDDDEKDKEHEELAEGSVDEVLDETEEDEDDDATPGFGDDGEVEEKWE